MLSFVLFINKDQGFGDCQFLNFAFYLFFYKRKLVRQPRGQKPQINTQQTLRDNDSGHIGVGRGRKDSSFSNCFQKPRPQELSPTNLSFSICCFRPKFHYQLHLKSLESQNPTSSSQRNRHQPSPIKNFPQKFFTEGQNFSNSTIPATAGLKVGLKQLLMISDVAFFLIYIIYNTQLSL